MLDSPQPQPPIPPASTQQLRYSIIHLDEIPPTPCPCGSARRAFVDDPDRVASLHVVETDGQARLHYHKQTTEIYYILQGEGQIELDGQSHPVRPGSAILIKPGCRHRLIGNVKFINVPVPAFDPADEWCD